MSNPESAIVAECLAEAGYGTAYYDRETNECSHECYASIMKVISGKDYWSQYDLVMSNALNHDFRLGFNFKTYRLTVDSDGKRKAIEVD